MALNPTAVSSSSSNEDHSTPQAENTSDQNHESLKPVPLHEQSLTPQTPLFNPHSPSPESRTTSPSPGTPLSDDGVAQSSVTSHATASTSVASAASTNATSVAVVTCSTCQQPMTGQFVKALGTVYHLDCFRCGDCQTVVAQKFFPVDGPDGKQQPLCETDYFRRLNLICAKCGLALRGSYITACNKKYHVEHFTCSICPTLFGQQDSYYEHENNVYCHFHYSTRFATKCVGCNSAILKQFVEINRNMKDECWHPECYMIHKFWNVKVWTKRPNSASMSETDLTEISYQEEEEKETATSLRERQSKMEQEVYRIWTVLSAFEESSAACISDMLRQVSNGQYLEAIRMAEKFILHVEVLFATIDDLELHFSRHHAKGMSHVREARMLCRKTVDLFTLLSRTQESESRRTGMTQELLSLVTGLAHYLKILIRIALTGALKLEREHGTRDPINGLLEKLHMLSVRGGNPVAKRLLKSAGEHINGVQENPGTQGVSYGYRSLAPENTGDSPFWGGDVSAPGSSKTSSPHPPSDLCTSCKLTVEEDCVRLGTYQRWHSSCIECKVCGKLAASPTVKPPLSADKDKDKEKEDGKEKDSPPKVSTVRRPPANVGEFVFEEIPGEKRSSFAIYCTSHAHPKCHAGFQAVSRLEQYAFLLNVALRRLYVLLKQRGVIQLSNETARSHHESKNSFDSQDFLPVKSVHLDRKLSATARLPQRSTVVESPSARTVHPTSLTTYQRDPHGSQRAVDVIPQSTRTLSKPPAAIQHPPIVTALSQNAVPIVHSPPIRSNSSPQSSPTSAQGEHAPRPDFARINTRIKIVDETVPVPFNREDPNMSRTSDDGLTLADIPSLVEAEQAREQRRSMPHQVDRPLLCDLSALELAIVKHCAVLALYKSTLKDQFDLDEILEMVEAKKSGFWKQLFKGAGEKNKNVKKKGVFGIPLELLVERDGFDSTLGISRTPLRVPSFIDDVISAMRQMDMSVEGVFRKNGNIRRLKDLSDAIDRDPSAVDLTTDNPVQLAALLKKFLRELPDPLFTFKLHRLFISSQSLQDDDECKRLLHMVSIILPKCNQDTLQVLFVFLKWVASFAHVDETGNRMDLHNLSTVIAPNILYAKGRDPAREESFGSIKVVTQFLELQDDFYVVPEEFIEILHDQEYFAGALDLPGKDFLKKCDTYMRLRSNGRVPLGPGSSLMSPILNGSHSPFHPQGPPFSPSPAASSSASTPKGDDGDIRLVPQRSDPALSRGRTTAGGEGSRAHSPRQRRAPDSRSLERGTADPLTLAPPRPLNKMTNSSYPLASSPPTYPSIPNGENHSSSTSQELNGNVGTRPRVQDMGRTPSQRGEGTTEYQRTYAPNSDRPANHNVMPLRPR